MSAFGTSPCGRLIPFRSRLQWLDNYHMTRKDDKGDQPSGGETTWTHTGATRSGRGQHKTG